MEKNTSKSPNQVGFLSEQEVALVQQFAKTRAAQKAELEYESFDGYEVPPASQFSMLKKPAVTFHYGQMKFSMAAIHLFEGIEYIVPTLNPAKKRLAIIMCSEEESSSVCWARRGRDGKWMNRDITAPDVIEGYFKLMGWDRTARYKVIGRLANSERGLILLFELEEAIITSTEVYVDSRTGEVRRRQIKYYPDQYKDRYGKSYNDYIQARQLSLFENLEGYVDGSEGSPDNGDTKSEPPFPSEEQ